MIAAKIQPREITLIDVTKVVYVAGSTTKCSKP
jgi:hypothetical protein